MTDEQLNYYYNKDVDKKQCWVSKDYNCPLKEQCNGLFKPECKEQITQRYIIVLRIRKGMLIMTLV